MREERFEIEHDFFRRFEEGLDTLHPEKSAIPFDFIGYGEISTVISFREKYSNLVFKRLPIFETEEQVINYDRIYREYANILEKAGLNLPWQDGFYIKTGFGYVYYNVQERLPSHWMGHKILFSAEDGEIMRMLEGVFYEYRKVFSYSEKQDEVKLGLDGQISNWAVCGYEKNSKRLPKELKFLYIDTGTPLYRKNGKEMLEATLFLKSIPFGLRTLVKKIFLKEILDRYYIMEFVITDMISNLIKEGRRDLVEKTVNLANEFLKKEGRTVTLKCEDIFSYYKRDTFIWSLFLRLRRAERFIKRRILKRHYQFLLYDKFVK